MGKSGVRSLPPLVYGRLAGVFEFAVEKVDITEKIFKNENCNLLVKIIWWGERKPLFIRPKKTQFITKENKEIIVNDSVGHSAKYEVHTNLKLFQSYLEKCEVVELVIVNSSQNEVIGSSFLQDLIYLVFNTQCCTNPIINHSGDSIGEISCQFLFKETGITKPEGIETNLKVLPVQKWTMESLKINLHPLNLQSSREEKINKFELDKKNNQNSYLDESFSSKKNIFDDFSSHRSSNMHYNSPVAQSFEVKVDSQTQDTFKTAEEKIKIMNDNSKNSKSMHLDSKRIDLEWYKKSKLVDSSKNISETNPEQVPMLPSNTKNKKKITHSAKSTHLINKMQEDNLRKNKMGNYTHSTKTANYKVNGYTENKAQKNKNISTEKTYATGKKNKERIINGKGLARNQKSSKISSGFVRPTGNIKTFAKVSKEISKLSKLHLDPSKVSGDSHSDLEKIPVKETVNHFHHLGGDHQEQYSIAELHVKLNNDEQNINITEFLGNAKSSKTNTAECMSDTFDDKQKQNDNLQNREKINVDNKLYFDLNDPVEKIYYETFFVKTESVCNNEFEIAELLNQPENKYILEATQKTTFAENVQQNDRPLLGGKEDVKSMYNHFPNKDDIRRNDTIDGKTSADPPKIRKDKEDSCIRSESIESDTGTYEASNLNIKIHKEYKSDCHHCKYYKKLSELDKIIDALKIFESRLKNDMVLSSESLNFKGCSNNILVDHSILPSSNSPAQIMKEFKYRGEHSDEELVGAEIEGSDFSKEDSDFIEFSHYLSQR